VRGVNTPLNCMLSMSTSAGPGASCKVLYLILRFSDSVESMTTVTTAVRDYGEAAVIGQRHQAGRAGRAFRARDDGRRGGPSKIAAAPTAAREPATIVDKRRASVRPSRHD
jgi:hypothetical protein